MKKKILGILFSVVVSSSLVGCSDSVDVDHQTTKNEARRVDVDYKIIKDEKRRNVKRTVEVLLPERVDKETLRRIAEKIYQDGFERTFIGYRVGGDTDTMYWATTNYNPDLEINIYGSDKQSHEKLMATNLVVDGELVGQWLANQAVYEYKAAIYRRDGKVYMKRLFPSGSDLEEELSVVNIDGQTRYYDRSGLEHGEYYTISPSGDLQFWSENGNYYTAPKILNVK